MSPFLIGEFCVDRSRVECSAYRAEALLVNLKVPSKRLILGDSKEDFFWGGVNEDWLIARSFLTSPTMRAKQRS